MIRPRGVSLAESHAAGCLAALDLLGQLEQFAARDTYAAATASRALAHHLDRRLDVDQRVINLYGRRALGPR